jgi:hypothetical protein
MPRPSRKSLAYLVSATAVSAGLGLALAPHALAQDQSQPRTTDANSGQCGNFLSDGAAGAGKVAACPLVDPKFSFQPPTDQATPPSASGNNTQNQDSGSSHHHHHSHHHSDEDR